MTSMKFTLRILLFGIFCSTASWGLLKATSKTEKAALTASEISAIRAGANLERSRKWLDAIDHYKKVIETYPNNRELTYGLRRAKIHYSIDRRYSDSSFKASLLNLSQPQALSILDDLQTKIRNYYVDEISSTYFIAHGTESLYLALNNERFLKRNLPNADRRSIQDFRRTLRSKYWNRPVTSSGGAQATVLEVARMAQSRLGLQDTATILEYAFGGCNALDDYSSFLTPGKLSDLYDNIEGEFVGLGIEMRAEDGKGLLLVNVLPESPAEEGGLLAGNYIVEIDGKDCRKMTTEEAAGLLTGPPNSRVRLAWTLSGKTAKSRRGEFGRRAVKVRSIPLYFIADKNEGIGYIRLTGFQKRTSQELDEALASLKDQGMQSLILDVRGNPGGLLMESAYVLDRFIDNGVLVTTRGRTQDQNWRYTANRLGTWDIPMALLIDENSASASEIVAGAIRDHNRGQLIGRHSYGKWSVQSIFPASEETGLRLSTAKFYSPNGGWYGKVGVQPDIKVEKRKEKVWQITKDTLRSDPDFNKAIEVLQEELLTSR